MSASETTTGFRALGDASSVYEVNDTDGTINVRV
jgi:hypothetical protein